MKRFSSWQIRQLISSDGIIYTVRTDREGNRQILSPRTCKWLPEEAVQFSLFPCWEGYHRKQYLGAKPYSPNTEASGGTSAPTNGSTS